MKKIVKSFIASALSLSCTFSIMPIMANPENESTPNIGSDIVISVDDHQNIVTLSNSDTTYKFYYDENGERIKYVTMNGDPVDISASIIHKESFVDPAEINKAVNSNWEYLRTDKFTFAEEAQDGFSLVAKLLVVANISLGYVVEVICELCGDYVGEFLGAVNTYYRGFKAYFVEKNYYDLSDNTKYKVDVTVYSGGYYSRFVTNYERYYELPPANR